MDFSHLRSRRTTLGRRPRRCLVKVVSARAVLQSAVFAFVVTGAAHAEHADKTAVPARELQAKIAYCENCHGVSGARISWILSNPATGGTATGIHKEPIAGIHRAPADQQYHVQCRPRAQPGDVGRSHNELSETQSQTARQRRSKRARCRREENLRRGTTRLRRSTMRLLSWPRSQRRRTISSLGWSAQRLRRQQTDQLDKGAGSKSGKAGRFGHHATDRAQLERTANQSRRSLSQRSGVSPFCAVQIMKRIRSHPLRIVGAAGLQVALLAIVFSAAERANSAERSAVVQGRRRGQAGVLPGLPRAVRARLSWIFSHAAPCRTANRVFEKSATGLR